MKVAEIHNEFMLLAQQMGMKTVRAILPEQVDEIINLETIEYVKMFSLVKVIVNSMVSLITL